MICTPQHAFFCRVRIYIRCKSDGLYRNNAHGFLVTVFNRPCDAYLVGLYRVVAHGLYTSHHLFLGNQMVDSLQKAQKALHASTPFVQHFVCIPGFGKGNYSRRPVDLGIDRLRGYQLTDIAFCLVLIQIEQLGESMHLYPGVVLRYNTNIVFDNPLA